MSERLTEKQHNFVTPHNHPYALDQEGRCMVCSIGYAGNVMYEQIVALRQQVADLTAKLATVTAERDQRKESFYADALMLRNVELLRACKECGGLGVKLYANTTTWRGGCGGQAMTNGVCDHCWGSGDRYLQWVDLRGAAQQLARFQAEIEDLRSKLQKALNH